MLQGHTQTPNAQTPDTSLEELRHGLHPTFTTTVTNVGRDDGKVAVREIDRIYLDEMMLVSDVSPSEAVSRFPGGPVTAEEIAGLRSGKITLIERPKWVWARNKYEILARCVPSEPEPASGLHASP